MKKSRKPGRKPETAGELLAVMPDFEMVYALDNMVRCRDAADYREMPELGRLITTLFEIERVADSEGLGHFILYSGERVADAKAFLGAIGAGRKAAILRRVEEMFPGGKIPESESERWEVMGGGSEEAEEEYDTHLDDVSDEWYATKDEDVLRLLRGYLEDHRTELDALIANRASKHASVIQYMPLTEEEIMRLAYAGDARALAGHEFDLLDIDRLPLLLQLAGDPRCTARQKLLGALYGISGSVASEMLSGRPSPELARLQTALDEAGASADGQMREWARRSQALLADPDPQLIMDWMAGAIAV